MATVSQAVIDAVAQVKNKDLRWAIFKIEGSDILVDATGAREQGMDEFRAAIDEPHCRYAVYDYEGVRADSSTIMKLCFIVFAPDSCSSMAEKMSL